MSGKNWFEWNGTRSTDYGLYVSEQPPITRPVERVSYITVPGRSGALTKTEGADVYDDLVLTAQCVMKDGSRIADITQWLKGSGTVEFANRQGGVYRARVSNQIPFEQVMRGRENRNCAIVFRCKPFWYVKNEPLVTLSASGSVTNEGSVYAEPIITVTGTGDGTLLVGGTIIELSGLSGTMTIDTELMEAYRGDESLNAHMSGDYPRLEPGINGISWTGGITGVTIKKNTRYL